MIKPLFLEIIGRKRGAYYLYNNHRHLDKKYNCGYNLTMEEEIEKPVIIKKEKRGVAGSRALAEYRSSNPDFTFVSGRPKGSRSFSTRWFEVLKILGDKENLTPEEVENELITTLYEEAKRGNMKALTNIFDRIYGKPVETHEITGKDGKDFVPDLSDVEKINLIKLIEK